MKLLSERLRGEADCAAGSAHPTVVQGLLEKAALAQKLESAVERMRGALEWYGNKENWQSESPHDESWLAPATEDQGQRARDVMEEIENEIE